MEYLKFKTDENEEIVLIGHEIQYENENNSMLEDVCTKKQKYKDIVKETEKNISKEISKIKPLVKSFVDAFSSGMSELEEFEIEMNIGISSTLGCVIVTGEVESSFKIRALWKKTDRIIIV